MRDIPKGEENDRFNCQELPHRVDGLKHVSGALVEVEEAVEGDPYGGKVGSSNVHVGAVPLEVALIIHPTQLSDAGQRHGHKQLLSGIHQQPTGIHRLCILHLCQQLCKL